MFPKALNTHTHMKKHKLLSAEDLSEIWLPNSKTKKKKRAEKEESGGDFPNQKLS